MVIPGPAYVHVLRKSMETGRQVNSSASTRLEGKQPQKIAVERMAARTLSVNVPTANCQDGMDHLIY